ncbi:hypothetical protein CDAR_503661 [Caerostris darwini]|uniref:Uncharacterized protein n=1 Tax=Caerostris darwini TaxID=1538125 RepID=A0AAV4NQM7_9ARAC|nr:hypothetical protein CDAR_503661 [Caerostris darwini]
MNTLMFLGGVPESKRIIQQQTTAKIPSLRVYLWFLDPIREFLRSPTSRKCHKRSYGRAYDHLIFYGCLLQAIPEVFMMGEGAFLTEIV